MTENFKRGDRVQHQSGQVYEVLVDYRDKNPQDARVWCHCVTGKGRSHRTVQAAKLTLLGAQS